VARHIFQACPVWIYTQSNNTQAYIKLVKSMWLTLSFGMWMAYRLPSPFTFPFDNSREIVELYKALRDTYCAQTRRRFVAHHRLSQARALYHSLGSPLQFQA
jgi:hypothetical protein